MKELCWALTGWDYIRSLNIQGSEVTAIKQCTKNKTANFNFDSSQKSGTICSSFREQYKDENDYMNLIERITILFNEDIKQDKSDIGYFFKNLIWIIKNDVTINDDVKFRTTFKNEEEISKKNIGNITSLEIQPFVASVLKYILTKTDNTNGENTFISWSRQIGYKGSKYDFRLPEEAYDFIQIDVDFCDLSEESWQQGKNVQPEPRVKKPVGSSPTVKIVVPSAVKGTRVWENLGESFEQLSAANDTDEVGYAKWQIVQDINNIFSDVALNFFTNSQDSDDSNWQNEFNKHSQRIRSVVNKYIAFVDSLNEDPNLIDIKKEVLFFSSDIYPIFAMLSALYAYEKDALEKSGESIGKEVRQSRIERIQRELKYAEKRVKKQETSINGMVAAYEHGDVKNRPSI